MASAILSTTAEPLVRVRFTTPHSYQRPPFGQVRRSRLRASVIGTSNFQGLCAKSTSFGCFLGQTPFSHGAKLMTPLPQRVFVLVCVWISASGLGGSSGRAAVDPIVGNRRFVKVSEIQLSRGNHHDLAFDGTQWYVASSFSNFWRIYNADFSLTGTTTVSGVSDMRGLAYNPLSNQLVVGDQDTGVIRFVHLNGPVITQFSTGHFTLEGLDFDARDSTIWIALFDGRIQQWSSSGQMLFSFDGLASLPSSFGWSSVAIDPTKNHLFAMHDEDDVFEFTMTGQLLGKILDDPFTAGNALERNGLGLHFDPQTMLLRVTSQSGRLATFLLVPEPVTAAFISFPVMLFAWQRFLSRQQKSASAADYRFPAFDPGNRQENWLALPCRKPQVPLKCAHMAAA